MPRVTGIGGLFFRAEKPAELSNWYHQHLGINPVPSDYGQQPWSQQAGPTVLAPFPSDTDYLPPEKKWMINFRVENLSALVDELRAAKIEVSDPESHPNGIFARLHDPEGNPIELWEPK